MHYHLEVEATDEIIALSSTEAEYMALSQSMKEVIPIMGLIQEMEQKDNLSASNKTKVCYKAFEDNVGAIGLARLPKMCPWTKHINIFFHHFCSYVTDGSISIEHIGSDKQEV